MLVTLFTPSFTFPAQHVVGKTVSMPSLLFKVVAVAQDYFRMLQSIALAVWGMKEVAFDGWRHLSLKVTERKQSFFQPLFSLLKDHTFLHGGLFFSSATFGGVAAAHELGWINVGRFALLSSLLSGASFIVANVVSLHFEALKLSRHATTPRARTSAILGIVAAATHIVAGVILLAGVPWPLMLALGGIATTFGAVKFCFDFSKRPA